MYQTYIRFNIYKLWIMLISCG